MFTVSKVLIEVFKDDYLILIKTDAHRHHIKKKKALVNSHLSHIITYDLLYHI